MADMQAINNQASSSFFRFFPLEIRQMIYRYFFSGAAIFFENENECIYCQPSGYSDSRSRPLALIKACRQTRLEIGNTWLHYITLSFESPWLMFRALCNLPRNTISEIRDVVVQSDKIGQHGHIYNWLPTALNLLKGLKLDRLSVIGGTDNMGGTQSAEDSYEIIHSLLEEGNGWKELNYVTQGDIRELSRWMHYEAKARAELDHLASHWPSMLNDRDGKATMPFVKIYRTAGKRAAETNVHRDLIYTGDMDSRPHIDPHFDDECPTVNCRSVAPNLPTGGWYGNLLIVARRGNNANYQQKYVHKTENWYERVSVEEMFCSKHASCMATLAHCPRPPRTILYSKRRRSF